MQSLTHRKTQRARVRGSAMIMSLVVLSALTFGAVVALNRSTLQVRMVNNMHIKNQLSTYANSYDEWLIQKTRDAEASPSGSSGISRFIIRSIEEHRRTGKWGTYSEDFVKAFGWDNSKVPNSKVVATAENSVTIENMTSTSGGNYLKGVSGSSPNFKAVHLRFHTTALNPGGSLPVNVQIGLQMFIPADND